MSYSLDRRNRQAEYFGMVEPYFEKQIYENAQMKIKELQRDEEGTEETEEENDKSKSSFKSDLLFSSQGHSESDHEEVKAANVKQAEDPFLTTAFS